MLGSILKVKNLGVLVMTKVEKFLDWFAEGGHTIIFIIAILIALVIVPLLFAQYDVSYTLTVDGVDYECEYFVLKDDCIEIHTDCIRDFGSVHSKYCSFYKIPIVESYSVEKHYMTNWKKWFGKDND